MALQGLSTIIVVRCRDIASPGPTQGNIRMMVYTGGHLKRAAPEHLPAPTLFAHSFYCWLLAWTAAVSLHLPTSALQSPALSPAQNWAFRRSLVKHGCITYCVHSVFSNHKLIRAHEASLSHSRFGPHESLCRLSITFPEAPAASDRRKARSPLPQQTSRAASPALAPDHFTVILFHTLCCPRLRVLFSCNKLLRLSSFELPAGTKSVPLGWYQRIHCI